MHAQTRVSMHTCIHIYRLPPVFHRGEEKQCVPEKPKRYLMSQNASGSVPRSEHFQTSGWILLCFWALGTKTRLLQTQTNELWQLNYTQVTNFVPFAQFIWIKINWNQRASFSVKICLSCQCMPLKPMGHFKSRY